MTSIQLKTYAKINLSLDVTGVRPNGYHEVAMVMQAIDLWDEMKVEITPSQENRIFITSDMINLPLNRENTAYKAAERMLQMYSSTGNDKTWDVHIHIDKKIPVAAGLAGGSSNAAGVILALNRLLHMDLSMERLCEEGEKIGADVPFCIMSAAACQPETGAAGGAVCVLAEGIGEILTPLPPCFFHTVLAKPPAGVSTAEVYRELDRISVPEHPDTEGMIEALSSGDIQQMASSMGNVLENVTFVLCPESRELKDHLGSSECIAAMMSGSGPTVFALFDSEEKAAAALESLNTEKYSDYSKILTKTLV